jgi:hypothetical protein
LSSVGVDKFEPTEIQGQREWWLGEDHLDKEIERARRKDVAIKSDFISHSTWLHVPNVI